MTDPEGVATHSIDGGFTVEIFPAGRADRRYLLTNPDFQGHWILICQSLHKGKSKVDWKVNLVPTKTKAKGTLATMLMNKNVFGPLNRVAYPGGLGAKPSQLTAAVRRSLSAETAYAVYSNPPMCFLQAFYVDKSGSPSRVEDHEELTTTGDAERRPITAAERKALNPYGSWSAGARASHGFTNCR